MPFTISHIDPKTKAEYPNAYWDFDRFEVEKTNRRVTALYLGYASKEAHDAGGEAISGLERVITLQGDEYLATMRLAEGSGLVTAIANLIDTLALEYKDVDTGIRETDGKLVKESFFKNAQRIAPDLSAIK